MARKKITVHRKGYVRSAYYRRPYRRKDGTLVKGAYVGATKVPPTTYKREDLGAPGTGPPLIKIRRHGAMTIVANEMGYERVSDIPTTKLKEYSKKLVKKYGAKTAFGMAHAQVVFRKRMRDGAKSKFQKIRDYIAELYPEALVPKKAIKKWESHPSSVRKRLMPEWDRERRKRLGMYYCTKCRKWHKPNSSIGRKHKRYRR
ncbi:MAG: hypothetical protein ACTSPL_04015 [Candidatus Odinarchaeia archaeon]